MFKVFGNLEFFVRILSVSARKRKDTLLYDKYKHHLPRILSVSLKTSKDETICPILTQDPKPCWLIRSTLDLFGLEGETKLWTSASLRQNEVETLFSDRGRGWSAFPVWNTELTPRPSEDDLRTKIPLHLLDRATAVRSSIGMGRRFRPALGWLDGFNHFSFSVSYCCNSNSKNAFLHGCAFFGREI